MVEQSGDVAEIEEEAPPPRRRRRWPRRLALALALILALGWFNRESIVDRIVSGQLKDLGLPGRYTIESAGASRQVLTNIVIGDPAHPDLTVEKAVVEIEPRLGLPTVGKVTLVRPRLWGTVKDAKASFGSLDKVLFAKSEKPIGLPDMELVLIDGRARLDTDWGPIGIKAEGKGNLRSGFSGVLAAIAPGLEGGGCRVERASLYGAITVKDARPGFAGPLRFRSAACPDKGARLADTGVKLEVSSSEAFDALDGRFSLASGGFAWGGAQGKALSGTGQFGFRQNAMTANYRIEAKQLSSAFADAGSLSIEGIVRSRDGLARIEGEGTLGGKAIAPGRELDQTLAGLVQSGQGTFAAPMAAQVRSALRREAPASVLGASWLLRADADGTSLTVPRAVLRGGSGADLLALSRVQLSSGKDGVPRLSGNLVTGGAGLPHLEGRFERRRDGTGGARLTMAEYRAGDARVALPLLVLAQTRTGELGFSGRAELSGALPGGRIEGLTIPLDGNWSSRRGLSAWRKCTPLHFARFAFANLSLDSRELRLCPGTQGAIVRSGPGGTRIAAGTQALNLSGKLGATPLRLVSGPVGLAWPGVMTARAIDLELGSAADPSRLHLGEIHASLGQQISGTFAGTEVRLNAVPLDVTEAQGQWSLVDGDLAVSQASLRLSDRQRDARFRPLVARDASLHLHGSDFTATAMLREPASDREVVEARIAHDMDDGRGHADLSVPGILFDKKLQPDTLSALALGVIANAQGKVTGSGRIDWTADRIASTGRFSTEGLDFAAAFGPTKGVSGTVEFTDLLGLVTAPDQRLRIAAINPGIEVGNGEVSFQLKGDNLLEVNGAHWPFLDGTLDLMPTRMVLGASEVRRYTLKVSGANAAKFVQQLELGNLSASGIFDGTLPLVFDQDGGHIVDGLLISRPPGGNVAYVGELTYKDLSAMGNFAFQALRSLDYKRMEVGLSGNLDGEIVTRVRFDGVSQGAGTKQNFATRALRGLPIQFNVNIRAPFYKLVTTFKALYDPNYMPDPRTLGLIGKDGKPVPPPGPAPAQPANVPPAAPLSGRDQDIQPPDSRNGP